MPNERHRKTLYVSGLILGGTIIFLMGAFSAKALLARNGVAGENLNANKKANNPFLTEGFDFKSLRAVNNEWRGPDLGLKIDLARLRMKDGKTLASLAGKRPIMLVAVHQDCGMCKIAVDEISHLSKKLATMDIRYYPVSFASQPQPDAFFNYADDLKLGVPGFLWNSEAGAPPEAVFIMTTPTHLLLNSDGTVIQVWPGSYQDLPVRQRMARQIVADTVVAIDTLNAIGGPAPSETTNRRASR